MTYYKCGCGEVFELDVIKLGPVRCPECLEWTAFIFIPNWKKIEDIRLLEELVG